MIVTNDRFDAWLDAWVTAWYHIGEIHAEWAPGPDEATEDIRRWYQRGVMMGLLQAQLTETVYPR